MSNFHAVRAADETSLNHTGRWIAYYSVERHILWTEIPETARASMTGAFDGRATPFPETPETRSLLDAAFLTRLPQCGITGLDFGAGKQDFAVKAFPDFTLNGQFKGVIAILENKDAVNGNRDAEVHTVLDLTLCGVVLYDPERDRILNVNRRAAQQTGYSTRELEAMSGRELWGDAGAGMLQSAFKRMGQAGKYMIWGQMLSIRCRDGSPECYFCSLRLIPARPDAEAPDVMMISMDVAEVDAATGAVHDGPNPRFVIEALQEDIWEYDTAARLLWYSASYADVFGPGGVPGGPGKRIDDWFDSVHPGDPERIVFNWRRLLKSGQRFRVQYRVRDMHGDWRWIASSIYAVLNDRSGRPARVLGYHTDITAAMRTERNLVDAEERLRLIFDNAGVGVVVAGVQGRIEQTNPALAIMLGRDRAQLSGHWLSEFAHPEDLGEIRDSLNRLLRGGRRETIQDVRFVRPDGREIWANITATLSRKIAGGDRYLIITVEDVTDGHAAREKIQYAATHDALTGAWSRGVLRERLSQHFHLAQRHGQSLAFCICDLDHFKSINDLYGHQAGDQVLVRFVQILNDSVRDSDVVGRYGGEEFAVIFPNTSVAGAYASMLRAADAMRGETFAAGEGGTFRVTATFGMSGVVADCTLKNVVAWADAALYRGKQNGRDQVVVANPPHGRMWLGCRDDGIEKEAEPCSAPESYGARG